MRSIVSQQDPWWDEGRHSGFTGLDQLAKVASVKELSLHLTVGYQDKQDNDRLHKCTANNDAQLVATKLVDLQDVI